MEHLLFLTGHLARPALQRVLDAMSPPPFGFEILDLGVSVAALMTAEMIERRLPGLLAERAQPVHDLPRIDRVLVPGRCRGDLQAVADRLGLRIERGPDELKDLPAFFDRAALPVSLDRDGTLLFAEIVDAPCLSIEALLLRAARLRADGADVIDLGCLPQTRFDHLEDAVRALREAGFVVSVDSVDADELLRAGRAGADYLLSLAPHQLWIAQEVASVPVLIASTPQDEASLDASIEAMQRAGRDCLADPILDPVPFGCAASLARYVRLRERHPRQRLLMGVGNLTELLGADTGGINALLLGLCAELRIEAVLTTQVSPHARRAVAEADCARRLMQAARRHGVWPKGLGESLLMLHERRPFPDTPAEIEALAAEVRDANFRVQVSEAGLHVYNRDGLRLGPGPFELWPRLGLQDDASHAFYMGVELARAEIAHRLGKRYVQDRPLDWGCAWTGSLA